MKSVCFFILMVGVWTDTLVGQTLTITNGVQTYATLVNTTVTMSNRCELRVTGTNNPISGSIINLNSVDAWFFLPNIRPSVVSASYLGQVRVNGAVAAAGGNCRLDQYAMGSVIIPQSPSFTPLQVFTGPNFLGASAQFGIYTYFNTPAALGVMNRNIGSFKLKRGYSATFAQNSDGTGISQVFVAQDGDLEVGVMAAELDHACSFVRVIPWRWTSKKGYGGGDGATTIVEPLWFYDWGDGSTSTLDREYLPMKWDETGNFNNINNKQKSTQVLGYNEPDSCSQANISVADALAIWPSLMQSGLRVGAPAVSDSGLTGEGLDWLYNFMDQATNRGYRVDYIPIHWYKCGQSATSFSNYLYTVYQKYGRPIWVTEWNNGASWCQGDISYATSVTAISSFVNMLESAPFVERYAIYPWWSDTSGLAVVTNNILTPVGAVYRNKQSALAYTQTLPSGGSRSIAQFHFESDTDDSSGYGNNGFAVGVPGFANGQSGQAVVLDGTNSFIRLPPNVANSAEFSFAGWVYWNGGASWQRIFDFGDDATHYLFLTPSSGSGTLRFAIRNGGSEQIIETSVLPAGQWQHVAVTLSGSTAKLYTNGVLAASSSSFTIVPSNFNPALNYFGKSQFPDPLFSGSLDEVQIADYAFTATQVASLMTNTSPEFTTNLISGGSATQGLAYNNTIAGSATDPHPGDTLTYSKASGPEWLTVATDGTLSGTPGIYDVATNNFTVRATDAAGASAFAVVTIALPNTANSGTWNTDADGNWTDTSKWIGGLLANGTAVTADFSTLPAGANRTVTLDDSRSIGTLKFGTRNWNLAASGGSVLTLENSSLTSPSIVVNQNTATITTSLAGWNGFTKSGAGMLILAANNSLSGVLNVDTGSTTTSDGIVRIAHPAALTKVSAIRLRNNSGASAGSTFQLDGTAGGITLNAPIALGGRNAAVVSIENVAGNNTLNGDIGINVGGGNYWFQSDAGLLTLGGVISPVATGSRTITFQGAGNFSITGFMENGCATTVSVVKSGAGTLTLNSANSYTGGTTVNGGTVNLAKGGSSGTIRNILNINSGSTVNLTATDALGYTNGGSGVTFVTTANIVGGTLNNSVNGNNGFNTKFNLTGGTMSSTGGGAYNFDGATGAGISSLASATVSTVSGNVALRSAGVVFSTAQGSVPSGIDLSISGAISGAFPIIKSGAGTLSLSGVNTYSGPTTINAGTLLISGAGRLGGGAYAANITNNGTFNFNSSLTQTLSGIHSGTGALIQSGPGTLTLSGPSTYSGNTTINGGRLALGSGVTLPNTPLIFVGAGGTLDVSGSGLTLGSAQTLKGNGTVLGNLTVNGTLAPGVSIGLLTANNNVTLGAGSMNIFEISKTPLTNDQLLVTGTLTYGGTLVVTNLAGTLAAGDSFQLFNVSSTSGVFAATNLPSLPAGFAWQWAPASGILSVVSAVSLDPTNLIAHLTGNLLQLSWPADHTGWRMETNAGDIADSNSWFTLPGSAVTNQVFIPIGPWSGHVFFRLIYP